MSPHAFPARPGTHIVGEGVRGDPGDGLPQHLGLVVDALDGEENLAGNSKRTQGEEGQGCFLVLVLINPSPVISFIMGASQTARQDSFPT